MAKNKPVKDKWLGARVDSATEGKVTEYLEAHEDLTMGALVRKAVNEYMLNHPHKSAHEDVTAVTKPGE